MNAKDRTREIRRLYEAMPDAPPVPLDNEYIRMWGEVENNRHWLFCEAIVDLVVGEEE